MAQVTVYKCNKCGSIYPSDYFEQWGRIYGIGQGKDPVCEALNSCYQQKIVVDINRPEKSMYPLENCGGQMSCTTMEDSKEIPYNVLAINDTKMEIRAPLMQKIQAAKRPELLMHLKGVVASYKAVGRPIPSHLIKL